MREHPDVAGLELDAAGTFDVIQEGAPCGPHSRNEFALTTALAASRPAVQGCPVGCSIPAAGRDGIAFTDFLRRRRQRRIPGVLVQVEYRIDAPFAKHRDRRGHFVEIGLVVFARAGLDARPADQKTHHSPAHGSDRVCVFLGECVGRKERVAVLPILDERVHVHAAKQDLAPRRIDDATALDRIRHRLQRWKRASRTCGAGAAVGIAAAGQSQQRDQEERWTE